MSIEPSFCLRRRTAGRPRKGEAEERRNLLLGVAAQLFMEAGFHRVSLARIASEAQVAVRTIYNAFGSKAGLFYAVLRTGQTSFLCGADALDPAGGSIAEVLGGFGLRYLHYLTAPQVVRMRRVILADAGASKELEHAFDDAGPGPARAVLAQYFSDPRVRVQLRHDVPLEMLPSVFIATVAGEYLWPPATGILDISDDALWRRLDATLALFLRSILLDAPDANAGAAHGSGPAGVDQDGAEVVDVGQGRTADN